MAIMGLREYARHRGSALSTVQKAIRSGRIPKLADGRIDSDAADAAWKQNTTTYAPPVTRRADHEEDDGAVFGANQYTKARAVREHYQARLAKIEYEEKVASLVSKDEVKIAQFNIDRQRRDAMLNIADRTCAAIAAEVKDILIAAGIPPEKADALDMSRIHEIMMVEIRKGLNDYADGLVN